MTIVARSNSARRARLAGRSGIADSQSGVRREWGGAPASRAGADLSPLVSPHEAALAAKLAEFPEGLARAAAELKEEGLDPKKVKHERELDMRYTGQGYELRQNPEVCCLFLCG